MSFKWMTCVGKRAYGKSRPRVLLYRTQTLRPLTNQYTIGRDRQPASACDLTEAFWLPHSGKPSNLHRMFGTRKRSVDFSAGEPANFVETGVRIQLQSEP